jgi:hypothetical protein
LTPVRRLRHRRRRRRRRRPRHRRQVRSSFGSGRNRRQPVVQFMRLKVYLHVRFHGRMSQPATNVIKLFVRN